MNERKPLPKPLQWPWCLILYAAALVALRLFGVLVIAAVEAVRRRYSPHGVQEGYCLARTRKKLIRLAGGLPLLALLQQAGDYQPAREELLRYKKTLFGKWVRRR